MTVVVEDRGTPLRVILPTGRVLTMRSSAMPTVATIGFTASVTQAEGNSGTTNFVFTVGRSAPLTGAASASWAVTGTGPNPASASDFVGGVFPSGTVNFAAGASSATITVPVAADTTNEVDETFAVTLSSPVGAVLGTSTAVGTITNDDVITYTDASALSAWSTEMSAVASKIDAAYFLAHTDPAQAKVNIVAPGTRDAVAVGSPVHTPHVGMKSGGAGHYLTTYNPATAGLNFSQNSHALGLWSVDSGADINIPVGFGNTWLNPRSTQGSNFNFYTQSAAAGADIRGTENDARGLSLMSRNASGSYDKWKNAELTYTNPTTSQALSSGTHWLLARTDGTSPTYDTTRRYAFAIWAGGLTEAEQKTLFLATGRLLNRTNVVLPEIQNTCCGALTSTGFTVCGDLAFAFEATARARLVVTTAADTGFAAPVFVGAWTQINWDAGGLHRPIKIAVTGLSPATQYIYRLEAQNGSVGATGSAKTALSTAGAFRFSVGSCHDVENGAGSMVNAPLIAANCAFHIQLGDQPYNDSNSIASFFNAQLGVRTEQIFRSKQFFRRGYLKFMADVHLNAPIHYMWSDHDFLGNDRTIDGTINGTSAATVASTAIGIYKEVVPHNALLDTSGNTLLQQWDYALCRFVLMDCQSQSKDSVPQILGAVQLQLVKDAITAAKLAGIKILFLLSPASWNDSAFNGFGEGGRQTERQSLCNHIVSTLAGASMKVVLLVGDDHLCYADDGAITNFSSPLTPARFMSASSSPLNKDAFTTANLNAPPFWKGVASDHPGTNQMLTVDVDAANDHCTLKFWNIISGTAILVHTYLTTDLNADTTTQKSWAPDTTAPTITSSNAGSIQEATPLSFSLTANEAVTWSIVGGVDQAKFEISGPNTLRFTANGTKSFTSPDDNDANNTYIVQVRATDPSNNFTNQTITITVTSGTGYSAEATALFARMTTQPTTTRKGLTDALISALKTSGTWAKLDAFYMEAAADSQAGYLNWKSSSYNLTVNGAPGFTADRGFITSDNTAWLDSGFNPTTAPSPNFTQNSGSLGVWSLTDLTGSGWVAGNLDAATGNLGTSITPKGGSNQARGRVTQSTAVDVTVANADGTGLYIVTRNDANTTTLHRNKTQLGQNVSSPSAAPLNNTITFGGRSGAYTGNPGKIRQAVGFFGSHLTTADRDAIYDACFAYLHDASVGAV